MKNEGPRERPFVVLSGGNDEFAVLDGDAHLLTGEESGVFDPEPGELDLGLYYYEARFYSPTFGRFLQTDPIGIKDNLTLYAYEGNNPVNRVDPTGLAKVAVGNQAAVQVAITGNWFVNKVVVSIICLYCVALTNNPKYASGVVLLQGAVLLAEPWTVPSNRSGGDERRSEPVCVCGE